MTPLSSSVVSLFSTLVLLGQLVTLFLLVIISATFFTPKNMRIKKIATLICQNYIALILIVSAIATMGSLTLSEVLNFSPCKLCWYQRIAMYPIFAISFIALLRNDDGVKRYVLPLSIIGFLIASYHILVQTFPKILECSDEVAKCSAREFAQYGYITIPVMSLTAFALILLLSIFGYLKKK